MYKYSKVTVVINFLFASALLAIALFLSVDVWYRVVIGLVGIMVLKDAFKERSASFELTGDRLIIKTNDKVLREIKYKEMKFLTITRKNKKWIVIADDEKILFTIKPKIENYKEMAAEVIDLNKSNKKLEVHDYIKKTYKR